jgi:hypothetical protein
VFDLVDPSWWKRLDADQLRVANTRVQGKDAFTERQKAEFARFVAKRSQRLAGGSNSGAP